MHSRLPAVLARVAQISAQLRGLGCSLPATEPRGSFQEHLVRASEQRTSPAADSHASDYDALISRAALKYGLSADLIHSVMRVESDYDPRCTSVAGAMGLMQLMPATAHSLGVTAPYDPAQNIDGGARFLRQQLDVFKNLPLALAAYNAGPGAVTRYGGVPPYRETQAYVSRVLQYLSQRTMR